jgi:hypothetical protein
MKQSSISQPKLQTSPPPTQKKKKKKKKKKKNHHSINVIEQIAHRLSKSNGNDIKNSQSPKTLNLHNSVK